MLCLGCGIVAVHPSAHEMPDGGTSGLGLLPGSGVCVCSSMTVTGASRQDLQMLLKITSGFCSCGGIDMLQSPGMLS